MSRMPGPSEGPEPSEGRSALTRFGMLIAVAAAMGLLVAGLTLPLAGVVGLAAKGASDGLDALPQDLEPGALPQRSTILDSKGTVIATLYDENRVNVQLAQIAKPMRQAILAIEDDRFYSHGALDAKGTLRAFITNKTNPGNVQGGSSITQQLVKLTLLADAGNDKAKRKAATEETYGRKLRELQYAIALEKAHSKDWILERYLNSAYFGAGAHGVQSAARRYFDKNASKLNVREAATIAGLVKNPVGYDPMRSPERALQRRNVVLDRMATLNVITAEKATRLKAQGLKLKVTQAPNGCTQSRAPFFCDYVLNYLEADPSLGKTTAERQQLLRSGGLTIHTTVDLAMQQAADESVQRNVFPTDQAIGGLALVQPGTGQVRALAQSRPMGSKVRRGQTYLNYVVNQKYGDSAGFSAGSTFKVFTLAAAISQGIPMTKVIDSPPKLTIKESEFSTCGDVPYGYGTWPLSNSTSSGPMTMYTGTQQSVNTYFAKLEAMTGLCEPFNLAKSMGVNLDNPTGDRYGNGAERVPSFTLGSPNASPLEMAEAYATFAASGLHCDSRPVTLISDSDGNDLKKYPDSCTQVMASDVANAVNDVLRGVQEPGGFGYSNGLALRVPSAGKTGTAQNQQAVWFVGYTTDLAGAAMIAGANSQGQPIRLGGQTIGGVYRGSASGSGFAGPIWGDAMKAVQDQFSGKDFEAPNGAAIRGLLVTVPDVLGMSQSEAADKLRSAGFRVVSGSRWNSTYREGTIAGTGPSRGSKLSSGDAVVLHESTGFIPKDKKKKKKKKRKNRDHDDD